MKKNQIQALLVKSNVRAGIVIGSITSGPKAGKPVGIVIGS